MSAVDLKSIPDIPVVPPGEDELPFDFGPPMESDVHLFQMHMLIEVLRLHWADRHDVYIGGNMAIYYSELQVKKNDFRGPDFFVVLDTNDRKRKSWVVWQEERTPDLVVELLSDSTERVDRVEKMRIYARTMHVTEYYLYDPLDQRFEAYRLDPDALVYRRADGGVPEAWSQVLKMRVLIREGTYQGITGPWLRFALEDGTILPTGAEMAEAEAARADEATRQVDEQRRRAETAEAERDRLLALLRAQGIAAS